MSICLISLNALGQSAFIDPVEDAPGPDDVVDDYDNRPGGSAPDGSQSEVGGNDNAGPWDDSYDEGGFFFSSLNPDDTPQQPGSDVEKPAQPGDKVRPGQPDSDVPKPKPMQGQALGILEYIFGCDGLLGLQPAFIGGV